MNRCTKCLMPDTRPGISFNKIGLCSACQAYENRKYINYETRFQELKILCDKYRGINGPNSYDCVIAVSGGKDSHYQVHILKEVLKMNPLLASVEDNFPLTDAGINNLKNISEEFGCNIISIKPNIKLQKKLMRYTFEKYAKPTYIIDRFIYTFPLSIAVKYSIPLVVYGENVDYEYGGHQKEETPSAKEQILNGVACGIEKEELIKIDEVTFKDLNFFDPPTKKELEKLDPIYLSYFIAWNSYSNYIFAKSRGFHDLTNEWKRTDHIEDFDQVDSRAYLIHQWLKYPKFGHAFATNYSSRFIRYGLITREEGIELIKKHDQNLDPLCVRDFCEFCDYSESEFWSIVDKFYNRDLFKKNEFNEWVLKNPII